MKAIPITGLFLIASFCAAVEEAGLIPEESAGNYEEALVAAGCFWSVELRYQRVPVYLF